MNAHGRLTLRHERLTLRWAFYCTESIGHPCGESGVRAERVLIYPNILVPHNRDHIFCAGIASTYVHRACVFRDSKIGKDTVYGLRCAVGSRVNSARGYAARDDGLCGSGGRL